MQWYPSWRVSKGFSTQVELFSTNLTQNLWLPFSCEIAVLQRAPSFVSVPISNPNLTLHTPYVKEEPFTTKEYHNIMKQLSNEEPKQKCQHCGTELNSLGDCPICDYGEEDLLED